MHGAAGRKVETWVETWPDQRNCVARDASRRTLWCEQRIEERAYGRRYVLLVDAQDGTVGATGQVAGDDQRFNVLARHLDRDDRGDATGAPFP